MLGKPMTRLTGKASDVSVNWHFAALAIVWIFKVDKAGGPVAVPHALLWPSALAIAASPVIFFSTSTDRPHGVFLTAGWRSIKN